MNGLQILRGDCRDILPTLEAGSVQTCVTSPPYWGLRDYGTAQWEGGEVGCEHTTTRRNHGDEKQSTSNGTSRDSLAGLTECRNCGARRIDAQLGLEATPEEYIANMVAVFREVWRVLRPDGTLWLNLGDCYASGTQGRNDGGYNGNGSFHGQPRHNETNPVQRKLVTGLKSKDLCMMPARVALALQSDGWYLRSDIIWHKPNPMPESVTDRPTKAHEYIFLLTKAERYFYDAEAIREPELVEGASAKQIAYQTRKYLELNKPEWGSIKGKLVNDSVSKWGPYGDTYKGGRNKRTVWTIPTQPYAEAHFATFPEELPKLCILAGSKPGDAVLDPFAGSGTVGQVALELGRRAILIELNPDYIELAEDRTFVTPGFL